MRKFSKVAVATAALIAVAPGGAEAKGVPASGVVDLATDADTTLGGVAQGDRAGWTVVGLGDVNGDGKDDLGVSAPNESAPGRKDAGVIHVVFGPVAPGRAALAQARGFTITGATAGDELGLGLAAAGDVNGDAKADIVVGASRADGLASGAGTGTTGATGATGATGNTGATGPSGATSTPPGAAYVIFGKADTAPVDAGTLGAGGLTISGGAPGDQLGLAVAGLGDVNGDAIPDVAVGAPRSDVGGKDAGVVHVVFGRKAAGTIDVSARGAETGYRIVGTPGSRAGLSVAGSPDVNGDNHPEVLLGAPAKARGKAIAGAAYLVHGRTTTADVPLETLGAGGLEFDGADGDLFGVTVSSLGDLDGDGRADVGVGAPRADVGSATDAGRAYVLLTPAPGAAAIDVTGGPTPAQGFRVDGANAGEQTGTAVEPVGDVDADGRLDIVVAAPFATAFGRAESGAAYVVRAQALVDTAAKENVAVNVAGLGAAGFRLGGPQPGAFIRSAASGGDLDADGAPDVVVGAIGAAPEGTAKGAGAAYVVLSAKPLPPAPPLPPDPGQKEEAAAGCTAATRTEVIVDDSGSMSYTDERNLRERALELLLAKPRNVGRTVGAVEFGDVSGELFPPQVIRDQATQPDQGDELRKVLQRSVVADNGGTDYNIGFSAGRSAAPKADARIFLTDGEHNVGEYADLHRGGPRTYVIGLTIGRKGEAAERLARIAKETKGRYFPNVKADTLQAVVNAIDSLLNCDTDIDAFVDALSDGNTSEPNEVDLDDGTYSADVNVSWSDEEAVITPGDVEVLDDDGDVVARLSARAQRLALGARGKRLDFGKLGVSGRRGKTYYALRITGVRGQRLRVRTASRELKGKRSTRVHTQIGQSRRRR